MLSSCWRTGGPLVVTYGADEPGEERGVLSSLFFLRYLCAYLQTKAKLCKSALILWCCPNCELVDCKAMRRECCESRILRSQMLGESKISAAVQMYVSLRVPGSPYVFSTMLLFPSAPAFLQEDAAPSAVIWYFVLSSSFDMWPGFTYCMHSNNAAGRLFTVFNSFFSCA